MAGIVVWGEEGVYEQIIINLFGALKHIFNKR